MQRRQMNWSNCYPSTGKSLHPDVCFLNRCLGISVVIFICRFDINPISTFLPQFLQSPQSRSTIFPPYVERERVILGRLLPSCGACSQPVRVLLFLCGFCAYDIVRVKVALRRENARPWHEVEADFLECEYRAVRDRQMKELEMEDDLLNKVPVR